MEELINWSLIDRRKSRFCCFSGSFVWSVALAAMTGSILFGFNASALNTAVDQIASDYGWCDGVDSDVDCTKAKWFKTLISTGLFFGAAMGAYFFGPYTGDFGLRKSTLCTLAVFFLGVVSSVCANSLSAQIFARFVTGIGVGVISGLTPNYIAEMVPARRRGMFGTMHQIILVGSQLLAMALGLVFKPIPDSDDAAAGTWTQPLLNKIWWRVMVGFALIPVLLAGVYFGYVFKFETPKYYFGRGRADISAELLRRIYGDEDVSEAMSTLNDSEGRSDVSPWSAKYRRCLLVGIGVAAFQQVTGINAFMANSNTLFRDAGLSSEIATYVSIALTATGLVCVVIPLLLLDRVGRKMLLLIGAIGMTLSTAPATVMYWIEWNKAESSTTGRALAIAGAILFMVFYSISIGPITWIYIVEIFPLEIKAKASSICVAANWISATLMVFLSGIIPAKLAYTIFTLASAVCVAFVLFCVKETKGRTLGDSPFVTSPLVTSS